MKKMMNLVALICVLNVIAATGIVGYLCFTGRVDGPKAKVMVDLVRHTGTPEKLRERIGEILEPTPVSTTAPTTRKGKEGSTMGPDDAAMGTVASAQERIALARQAMEQERIQLDAQAQALRDRQKSLMDMQARLDDAQAKLDAEKKAFEPKAATADDRAKAENFQKMMTLYDELKTKQVKDLFMDGQKEELVAAYLTAMDPSRAAKIIGEFKTDTEQKFLSRVLERIRVNGTSSATRPAADGNVAAAASKP